MAKPLAFVSGGLQNLLQYLKSRANKYLGKTLLWLGFGFLMTTIFCISVQIMMEKYKTIQIWEKDDVNTVIMIKNSICEECNKNKREILYDPCEHFSLCEECFNKKEDKT